MALQICTSFNVVGNDCEHSYVKCNLQFDAYHSSSWKDESRFKLTKIKLFSVKYYFFLIVAEIRKKCGHFFHPGWSQTCNKKGRMFKY